MSNGDSQYTMEVRFVAADEGLTKVLGEVEKATGRVEEKTRLAGRGMREFGDVGAGQATRGVRLLASGIASELDPSLGALIGRLSQATIGLRIMGLSLSGPVIVGIGAAIAAFTLLIKKINDAATVSAKFNIAIAQGVSGPALSAINELNLALEESSEKIKTYGGRFIETYSRFARDIFAGKVPFTTGEDPNIEKRGKALEVFDLTRAIEFKAQLAQSTAQLMKMKEAEAALGAPLWLQTRLTLSEAASKRYLDLTIAIDKAATAEKNAVKEAATAQLRQLAGGGLEGAPLRREEKRLGKLRDDQFAAIDRQAGIKRRRATEQFFTQQDPAFAQMVSQAGQAGLVVGNAFGEGLKSELAETLAKLAPLQQQEGLRQLALSYLGLTDPDLAALEGEVLERIKKLRAIGIRVPLTTVTQPTKGGRPVLVSGGSEEELIIREQEELKGAFSRFIERGVPEAAERAMRESIVQTAQEFEKLGLILYRTFTKSVTNVAGGTATSEFAIAFDESIRDMLEEANKKALEAKNIGRLPAGQRPLAQAKFSAVEAAKQMFGELAPEIQAAVKKAAELDFDFQKEITSSLLGVPLGDRRTLIEITNQLRSQARELGETGKFTVQEFIDQAKQVFKERRQDFSDSIGGFFKQAVKQARTSLAREMAGLGLAIDPEVISAQVDRNLRRQAEDKLDQIGTAFEVAAKTRLRQTARQVEELGADISEALIIGMVKANRIGDAARLLEQALVAPLDAAIAMAEQRMRDPRLTMTQQGEAGIQAGLLRTRREVGEFGEDMARATQEIGATMGRGLGDAFFNFSTGQLNKFSDVWTNLWQGLARTASDITSRLITRLLLEWLGFGKQMETMRFGGGMGGGSGFGVGSLLSLIGMGGGGGAASMGVGVNDWIGILEAGGTFVPMQHGGIVTKPTFGLMGEHGPEAVIPLSQMGAGGMGGGVTVITLIKEEELAAIMAQEVGKGRQVVVVDVLDNIRNNKMMRRGLRSFA